MKIPLPQNNYIKKIEVGTDGIDVEFAPKQKIALLFISLNDRYWPYLAQVIKDCRQNFLPHHKVDYFVWTDYNEESKKKQLDSLDRLAAEYNKTKSQELLNGVVNTFASILRLYGLFYPQEVQKAITSLGGQGLFFKVEGPKFWIESPRPVNEADVILLIEASKDILRHSHKDMDEVLQGTIVSDTAPVEWPAPTLMRYHLFLSQEEKLKEYDHVLYLDADMRVLTKISDEVLSEGLLSAEHPMYSLRKEYIPPYEPNEESTAFIKRPGRILDENGKKRFKPYYYAGGFQGGKADLFIEAMRTMKKNIDKDFDNNYTAIWNDESHWNKYLFEYTGPLVVLSPSYIYPDSLIKEYYEKIWGQSYEPKIMTLTKPFSLSSQGAEEINKFIEGK